MEVCGVYQPEQTAVSESHSAACWLQDPRAKQVFQQPIKINLKTAQE
jgi:dipeptide transport system ATP-binding protein